MAAQYRSDLERRYPLCQACRYYVEQRLNAISLKLKTKKIASHKVSTMNKVQEFERIRRESRSRSVIRPLLNLIFDGCLLAAHYNVLLPSFINPDQRLILNVLLEKLPNLDFQTLFTVSGVLNVGLSIRSGIWETFLYTILALLRFVLHCKTPDEQISIILTALIVLINLSLLTRREVSSKRSKNFEEKVAETLPLNPINHRSQSSSAIKQHLPEASPSKTIINDLMELDFGLGTHKVSSQSYLQTPKVFAPPNLASFSSVDRKPMFAPSKLDPSRSIASLQSSPVVNQKASVFPKLRQPILQVNEKPSGLENVIQGFSLSESTQNDDHQMQKQSEPTIKLPSIKLPDIKELGFIGELAMTCSYIGLRILVRNFVPLIIVILASSFWCRGYIWKQMNPEMRFGYIVLFALRFACLAAQLAEPEFARIMLGSLWLRLFALFFDLSILSLR